MRFDPAILMPGDVLLYGRTPFRKSCLGWFFGAVINVKTWSRFSHVEIYDGEGESLASRDGEGVGCYPLRTAQLRCVRRPGPYFDVDAVRWWFDRVDGQKYDWLGLLCFTLAAKRGSPDKMFCSEFVTRALREGRVRPFNPALDADKVAPAQLWQTPALETVWEAS